MVNCGNKTGKKSNTEQGIKFYRVPAVLTDEGELIEKLTAERRRKWISAISREDLKEKKLSDDRVCSVHFVSGKPAKNWDRHNQDWVPTLKLGHSKQSFNSTAAVAERNDRVLNRRKRALETELEKRNEKLKRLLNQNLSLRRISGVMMIKSNFLLGYHALMS